MVEAAKEEYRLAEEEGKVRNGIADCTVVVDGGWSQRSYGHSYKAKSGVACIIGKRCKKILFLGVRNKYCSICAIARRNNVCVREHDCYCNWSGSSPAMEADILAEGFRNSETTQQLRYTTFIGDGDSNVFSKILESCPYARHIRKIECANHLVKNATKHLHIFASENSKNKKLMPAHVINHIGKFSRKIIAIYSTRENTNSTELREHLLNVVPHVYGNHTNCSQEYCLKAAESKLESSYANATVEQRSRIMSIISHLASKSDSLLENSTSNLAEQYMHQIAKFAGAKAIFYGQRNAYNIRCYGAGLMYNQGAEWLTSSWRRLMQRTPNKHLKRIVHRKVAASKKQIKRRKLTFVKEDATPLNNESYGPNCQQPDLPDEEISRLIKLQVEVLDVSPEEQMQICKSTIAQADSDQWHSERRFRLTASRFGEICKRRARFGVLVKQYLYGSPVHNAAVQYGKLNEDVALKAYTALTGRKVENCGLFVCVGKGKGFLAASPDGIVGHDRLVEVKCPYSARDLNPVDIPAKKKSFCSTLKDGKLHLKPSHNYFYQVQGQMYITGRRICDFVVWTPKGLSVEEIQFDPGFVKTMVEKLETFYLNHYGPELVDSRRFRHFKIRDSD